MKKLTFDQAKQTIFEKSGLELLDYPGALSKCTFKCPRCNNTFQATYHNMKINGSCQYCHRSDYKKKITEKAYDIHGDRYNYLEIPEHNTGSFKYECNTCGQTHVQRVANHITAKQGCPRCCKPTGGYGRVSYAMFTYHPELCNKKATFYVVEMTDRYTMEVKYKFGVTTINLALRLANVRYHSKCDLKIVYREVGSYIDMYHLEQQLSKKVLKCVGTKWLGSGETFSNDNWEELLKQCEKKYPMGC